MKSGNYELELYKLITDPDEDLEDLSYVSEFGWVSEKEFFIWVDWIWFKDFMEKLTEIFGEGIFEEGNFNANIQPDSVCVDLADALGGRVDIKNVFPYEKYKH